MKPSSNTLAHFLEWTIQVLEGIASVVLVIMMVLTLVDVVGRYVFSAPVFGASELVTMLLAVVIFAGLGICNAHDQHIVVGLFDRKFKRLFPRYYDVIIQVMSLAAMLLIVGALLELALESYQHNSRTTVLDFPMFFVIATISLLALIGVFSLLAGLIVASGKEKTA